MRLSLIAVAICFLFGGTYLALAQSNVSSRLDGYTSATDVVLGVGAGPGSGRTTQSVIIGPGAAPGAPSVGDDVAIGYQAMRNYTNYTTDGPPGGSVAVGYKALSTCADCFGNVAIGTNALLNFAGGASSLDQENLAIGYNPASSLTTGHINIALGTYALTTETTGSFNTAIGFHALYTQSGASGNIGIGNRAGQSITTGSNLIAIGDTVLGKDTTDGGHLGIGYQALHEMVTSLSGGHSVAIGGSALYHDTGGGNTAVGDGAGYTLGAGYENTVIGDHAGYNITTGQNDVCLGAQTCNATLTTGKGAIVIGYNIDVANATANNQLNIGGAITGVMGTQLTVSSPVAYKAQIATVYDYATPVTTNTVTAATNSVGCSINPSGTIAALTIQLPASPVDGQIYTCGFSQVVSAITWQDSGGTAGNVVGGPASSAVGTHAAFVYHSADTKWHPI